MTLTLARFSFSKSRQSLAVTTLRWMISRLTVRPAKLLAAAWATAWAYRAASGSAALAASVFEKRAAIEEELVMMHSPSP